MLIIVKILHAIVCMALILIVLLQTGKSGMGSLFGGGSGSDSLLGTGASKFLTRATTIAAVVFMITSLILTYHSGKRESVSIMKKVGSAPVNQNLDIDVKTPAKQVLLQIPAPQNQTAGTNSSN